MQTDDPTCTRDVSVGAYGFRVEGFSYVARALLGRVPSSWPSLELSAVTGETDDRTAFITPSRGRVALGNRGEIVVERLPLRAEIRLPELPREEELLHPYLAYAAGIAARWFERECIHAGAFVVDGGVWAFVGDRGAGKSTTLAWLASRGIEVVCDDMLVVDGARVFPGPRFVDLRAEAARALDAGEPLGVVGARERWRLKLGPIAPDLPLRGWVFLDWSPAIEVRRASAARRLQTINDQIALFGTPRDPTSLLRYAELPGWELRRPRGWASVGDSTDQLLAAIRG